MWMWIYIIQHPIKEKVTDVREKIMSFLLFSLLGASDFDHVTVCVCVNPLFLFIVTLFSCRKKEFLFLSTGHKSQTLRKRAFMTYNIIHPQWVVSLKDNDTMIPILGLSLCPTVLYKIHQIYIMPTSFSVCIIWKWIKKNNKPLLFSFGVCTMCVYAVHIYTRDKRSCQGNSMTHTKVVHTHEIIKC